MEDRLRSKLQAFIDAHPDVIPRDDALRLLLDLGLDRAADRSCSDLVDETKRAARDQRLAMAQRR